jgi:hypothetical protein
LQGSHIRSWMFSSRNLLSFSGVRVAQSLVFCVLFVFFCFVHWIVCPFTNYDFQLPVSSNFSYTQKTKDWATRTPLKLRRFLEENIQDLIWLPCILKNCSLWPRHISIQQMSAPVSIVVFSVLFVVHFVAGYCGIVMRLKRLLIVAVWFFLISVEELLFNYKPVSNKTHRHRFVWFIRFIQGYN